MNTQLELKYIPKISDDNKVLLFGIFPKKTSICTNPIAITEVNETCNSIEAEANAKIIVKAVNNHDKLVEAVKKLKGRIIFLEMATEDKFDLTDFTKINELLESLK